MKLAINGGPKTIKRPFPAYNSLGQKEVQAGLRVLKSGKLSGFFGSWSDRFYGGPEVQKFEREWARTFKTKYAVSFNSLTSGLIAAVGAIGIEPGDEVIVSPWTMCATATAILVWNAIPVFADIDERTFNLDPASIEKNITPRTRAIVVTHIFGHPADMKKIMALAKKYKLKVIEDAAQAPLASYHGRLAGTIGHIGGFSLNYHKHIHTGEGGVMVTNDRRLAERLQLIRNHGEAVVGPKKEREISNIIGFNFRLGEIEAAIGREQLKKLKKITWQRNKVGIKLSRSLAQLKGLVPAYQEKDCSHVYYIYPIKINENAIGISRKKLVEALQAEGIPWIYEGYTLVHLLPIYQKKTAYGRGGFPWTSGEYKGKVSYKKGICPVAERMHEKKLICLQINQHNYTDSEINQVINAFRKVWTNLEEL